MNITGGTNLSLFEVQEAADIVASASDEEVNMIFGSVINENLNDEIIVTVIATGFSDDVAQQRPQNTRPMGNVRNTQTQQQQSPIRERVQEQPVQQQEPQRQVYQQEDMLDIPTFLRNRRNRG